MTTPTILITGGTGKFGRCFVEYFCRKGWQVIFTSTSGERAKGLEVEMGQGASGLVCDLMQHESGIRLVEELQHRQISVNHLVNNARSLAFLQMDEAGVTQREHFLSEYLMDVVVPYELSIALWQAQPKALETITNISSQYGVVAANPELYDDYYRQSAIQYGVAKAGLNHLTKELAVRLAPDGIRVNAIAYGGVEGRVDDGFRTRYGRLVPMGRMLKETELTGPLDFLVSEQSSAMTGQVVQPDGGWTLW
ncbi:SDR family oxidoreductase [Billgrantia antri]|uniref:SDR family oxidoreductase n=1 Tax=Billgrantia antri TaxID=2846777 RepID=A0ABS6ZPN2_9GAMM|nr:SDR family oxidoreductase [Halomonas antri]MBW6392008.1 SDR family oxidoreductase [Halomonas antri]